MKDILRAAIAVPALKVADVTYNKNAILARIGEAHEAGATLLVTPELSLTGATCGDLFHADLLLDEAETALLELAEATPADMLVIVGSPLEIAGRLYNCAVVLCAGEIKAIIPQTHLTAADQRIFASGEELDGASIQIGEQNVPIDAAQLLVSAEFLCDELTCSVRYRFQTLNEEACDAWDKLHHRTHLDAESESCRNIVNKFL